MRKLLVILISAFLLLPQLARAATLGRAAARAASRRAMRVQILKLDARRHRMPVRPLPQPRTVHRYTSWTRAMWETRHGIPPNRHMSAVARRGRPSAQRAKQYYGLLRKPSARETIRLEKGFPLRHSHATNAARGVRELTSPKPVPPEAIKNVIRLR